jgi:hypothetical protein
MTLAGGVGAGVGDGAAGGRRGAAHPTNSNAAMDGSVSAQPRQAALWFLKAPPAA